MDKQCKTDIETAIKNTDKVYGLNYDQALKQRAAILKEKLEKCELSKKIYIYPFNDPYIYSDYKMRNGTMHWGLDLVKNDGTTSGHEVKAVIGGVVVKCVKDLDGDAGGRRVRIQDEDGYQYNYFHLLEDSNDNIEVGQIIKQGDVIGKIGGSGYLDENKYGHHLHYEIWDNANQKISPYTVHTGLDLLPLYPK